MAHSNLAKIYKQLIAECGRFTDYNFRGHAIRRVKYNYEKYLKDVDESKLPQIVSQAEEDLKLLQRQVTIGQLYAAERHILDKAETT